MSKSTTRRGDQGKRLKPPVRDDRPEAGYEAWLETEIEAGCRELDEGKGVPAEKVWKDLGLE
ncbi:MAG TPA: hypothetical protein VFR34_01045 [Paracoccaceae bacterium]|nr:hypothetical protein [Paracoccaceae bacterium]